MDKAIRRINDQAKLDIIYDIISDVRKSVNFAYSSTFFLDKVRCSHCNGTLGRQERNKNLDGVTKRCNICKREKSPRYLTMIYQVRLPLPIIFKVFYDCFGRKNNSIKETATECDISFPTAQSLLDKIRTAVTHKILKDQAHSMVGGFGVDVELDETMITHTDCVQIWLIGVVERNSPRRCMVLFPEA